MAEWLLSSLILGGRTFRSGRDLLDCHRTFRGNCFPWRGYEANRTTLYRDTRSHLCGSDSSAVAANKRLGVPVTLPQHPDEHRPQSDPPPELPASRVGSTSSMWAERAR